MAKAPTSVSAASLLQALYRKQAGLQAQDKAALARQIELERAGHQPIERPEPQPHIDRARELLNGSGHLLPGQGDQPEVELWAVLNERKALAVALDVLQKEEVRTGSLGLAEWMGNGGLDRWHANRRRLADALLAVQASVAEGRDIRTEAIVAAGGQGVSLPGDRGDKPLLHQDAMTVLDALRAEGMLGATT